MSIKRLRYYRIHEVEEVCKKDSMSTVLMCVPLDALTGHESAPEGTFIPQPGALILPKRKRGVKFRVTYTEIFQKEL